MNEAGMNESASRGAERIDHYRSLNLLKQMSI